jgi:GNAT superfamily N-acetyltransferase
MIQVIHDNEGVHSVRIHNTTYSPEALVLMASEVERLRAGLRAIVSDADVIPWPFADELLRGASVEAARAASEPIEPPSEAVEASYQRLLARRELVKAALRWAKALSEQEFIEANTALYRAAAAFRAAGGNEVTG